MMGLPAEQLAADLRSLAATHVAEGRAVAAEKFTRLAAEVMDYVAMDRGATARKATR